MNMVSIQKIVEVLSFLEEKNNVKFQYKLLDSSIENITEIIKREDEEENIEELKGCYSQLHNTDYLGCMYYYKKNY